MWHSASAARMEQQEQQQQEHADDSGGRNRARGKSALRRLVRCGIAAIRTLLVLELVSLAVGPLVSRQLRRRRGSDGGSDDGSGSDLDPADCLMDYLTGRTGLAAVQLLSNRQLRAAVDNLITEDFQELGVLDRGAELRDIVEDIIVAREGRTDGAAAAPAGSSSSSSRERVGVGRVGPLRFRNARPAPLRRSSGGDGDDSNAAAAPGVAADDQQQ